MNITRRSQTSGITRTLDIPITEGQLLAYLNGQHIQHAMPHLTPDQREFIITGIIQEEWDKLFPPEEDDADENAPAF